MSRSGRCARLNYCICKISVKERPAEYIRRTFGGHLKTRENSTKQYRPSDNAALSKYERDSIIALRAIAERHNMDYENTEIL